MRYDEAGQPLPIGHPDHLRLVECNCGKVKAERTYRLDGQLGFEGDLRLITWQDVKPLPAQLPAQERVKRFITLPSGWVYLHGVYGNGKTTLAALAVNLLRRSGYDAVFANVPVFLSYLRRCLGSGQADEYPATLDYVQRVRVLALDDLGAEKSTEWAAEQLYEVLNYRYVKRLPTIITSNLAPDGLGDGRLASRLRDVAYSTVLNCGNGDIRTVAR